jgi:hypothetical protein
MFLEPLEMFYTCQAIHYLAQEVMIFLLQKLMQMVKKIWTKQIGGFNSSFMHWEGINAVYDSITNCLFLSGKYYGVVNFDTVATLFSTAGTTDIFIARMDLNGNFIWAKRVWGNDNELCNIYSNQKGKIYLVAQSNDSLIFDNFHIGPGGSLAQYDMNGNCIAAKKLFNSATGPNSNTVLISFLGSDIVFYGAYRSSPFELDTVVLNPDGNFDAFIARADSNGNVKWVKHFGGLNLEAFQGLAVDDSSNLYVTGGFQDSITIGSHVLLNNGPDILFAKFDQLGNLLWANQAFVSGSNASASKIISDHFGNCYFVGIYSGNASFGNFNITTSNQYDMFITKYDYNGNCIGISHFGTANTTNLAIDHAGSVYCTGVFKNAVSIGTNVLTALGGGDIFIAKHDAITGFKGFEKSTSTNQLLIQANPNSGKCNISIPDEFAHEKNLSLSIYNNKGQLIHQLPIQLNENKIKLNLEAEAKGMYNAVLSNGTKNYSGKIIFE